MNKFIDLKTIKYDDLLLKPLEKNDNTFINKLFSDYEVVKYTDLPVHETLTQSNEFINMMLKRYEDNSGAMWTVTEISSGVKAGLIGLLHYNQKHCYASFASTLLKEYWNKGIMTKAHIILINYAFKTSKINRIESQFYAKHVAVEKMLLKSGMLFEGVLKQNFLIEGEFCDSKLYAITKSDYYENKTLQIDYTLQ
ncbi:MAG: hypothetical protein Kow0068_07710 [Marinilabiliales bacterium]